MRFTDIAGEREREKGRDFYALWARKGEELSYKENEWVIFVILSYKE